MRQAHYDLVILGSGSTAFAAALRAQELGKTSVMTEERMTGGTCVNRGCLPSKNLIEAAKIIHDARHPRYPGLAPAEVRLNFRELIAQKDDVVHGYRKKKYESLVGGQVSIEEGHAEFLEKKSSLPLARARSRPPSKGWMRCHISRATCSLTTSRWNYGSFHAH